ncbi:hypothetical protein EDB89DRAFT_1908990 [Lactarius sanguifluus]|nr:hypothetical protein EDB89DRAFT_1908990 [Lactarius sanguifluus]
MNGGQDNPEMDAAVYRVGRLPRRSVVRAVQISKREYGYSYDRSEPLDDAVARFGRGIGKVKATTAEVQYLALPQLTPRCIRLRSSTPTMVHRDLSMAAGAVSEMSRKIPAEGPSCSSAEEQNHLKASPGGNKSYVGLECGTAIRVYVNRRSRGLRPTDKGATSVASANCVQKSGYEVSAGDTTCDRSEAYTKIPHEDCGRQTTVTWAVDEGRVAPTKEGPRI